MSRLEIQLDKYSNDQEGNLLSKPPIYYIISEVSLFLLASMYYLSVTKLHKIIQPRIQTKLRIEKAKEG